MYELNSLLENFGTLKFGDYVLFQEYIQTSYNKEEKQHYYQISKPIYAIYLGHFFADQTIGCNYVKIINPNKTVKRTITVKDQTFDVYNAKEAELYNHIEWTDYINIIDIWKYKPSFSELRKARMTCYQNILIPSNNIIWKKE